jgi:hypothetical protein
MRILGHFCPIYIFMTIRGMVIAWMKIMHSMYVRFMKKAPHRGRQIRNNFSRRRAPEIVSCLSPPMIGVRRTLRGGATGSFDSSTTSAISCEYLASVSTYAVSIFFPFAARDFLLGMEHTQILHSISHSFSLHSSHFFSVRLIYLLRILFLA